MWNARTRVTNAANASSAGMGRAGRVKRGALNGEEIADTAFGEREQRVEIAPVERCSLGRPLQLHETSCIGHEDVHIDVSLTILLVREVEERISAHDAD